MEESNTEFLNGRVIHDHITGAQLIFVVRDAVTLNNVYIQFIYESPKYTRNFFRFSASTA